MKKCFHCGKKSKEIILADDEEDEKVYLCRKCCNEENKSLKERVSHAKSAFERQ